MTERPRPRARLAGALAAIGLLSGWGSPGFARPLPVPGECSAGPGMRRCLYRSAVPSVGLLSECDGSRCRVGFYYGRIDTPEWLTPPEGWTAFPPPEVRWPSATLAEVRFGCGASCSVSYFFEARRQRLSPPRRDVVALDERRLLVAQGEGRSLVARQVYSGREVARIERSWAPGLTAVEAIQDARFEPDGRLSITWMQAGDRPPMTERITVPSIPR